MYTPMITGPGLAPKPPKKFDWILILLISLVLGLVALAIITKNL